VLRDEHRGRQGRDVRFVAILVAVIADTTSATANAYGSGPAGFIVIAVTRHLLHRPGIALDLLIDPRGKSPGVICRPPSFANDCGLPSWGGLWQSRLYAQGRPPVI